MSEDTKENITIIVAMVVAAVCSFWIVSVIRDTTNKETKKEEPVRIQEITVVDVATGDTLVVHLNKYPYAVKK